MYTAFFFLMNPNLHMVTGVCPDTVMPFGMKYLQELSLMCKFAEELARTDM